MLIDFSKVQVKRYKTEATANTHRARFAAYLDPNITYTILPISVDGGFEYLIVLFPSEAQLQDCIGAMHAGMNAYTFRR